MSPFGTSRFYTNLMVSSLQWVTPMQLLDSVRSGKRISLFFAVLDPAIAAHL